MPLVPMPRFVILTILIDFMTAARLSTVTLINCAGFFRWYNCSAIHFRGSLLLDAYHASSDLSIQIELYRERFGFLPEKNYADKIYMNKGNRKLMKDWEIQAMSKPLGRPDKEMQTKNAKLRWQKLLVSETR